MFDLFHGMEAYDKGILKPNTMLPFTALPCKYKTRIEQIATERNPNPGDADKLTKAGSRKVKVVFLLKKCRTKHLNKPNDSYQSGQDSKE